jgi:hypothetical protein
VNGKYGKECCGSPYQEGEDIGVVCHSFVWIMARILRAKIVFFSLNLPVFIVEMAFFYPLEHIFERMLPFCGR